MARLALWRYQKHTTGPHCWLADEPEIEFAAYIGGAPRNTTVTVTVTSETPPGEEKPKGRKSIVVTLSCLALCVS